MRREGRKHSDTFNDKLATNNTIHAVNTRSMYYYNELYILPENVSLHDAKKIHSLGSPSHYARQCRQNTLQSLLNELERNLEQMKGASPARTRKNRNPATCRWSTSKETQPGKREKSNVVDIDNMALMIQNVKTAISSKHLRLPYMDPAATSPLYREVCALDVIANNDVRLIYYESNIISFQLEKAGFGPKRTWESLAPEEMERLYAQIDSWTDLNLDKVWNVNMSTGRRATIFESEEDAKKKDDKYRWHLQTKSKRRPSYWNEWDMGGKDMESSAKLRARMGGMRGNTREVLFEVLTSYR